MKTLDILDRLIDFDSTSRNPNLELIHFIRDLLAPTGAAIEIIADASGGKANLYATIGPQDGPGVLLSGHTDVVPVDGQNWTVPPFQMTLSEDRVFGRGTTDMKGFIASALAMALRADGETLKTPLHLAFSYDEEIGCVGVHSLIDMLANAPFRPAMCIIGEPTSLAVATGHKGKTGARVLCTGREGHSALAPFALNAVYMANDLIAAIRAEQARLIREGASDAGYDVPYTTLHVGRIEGGGALNIVPNACRFDFEIRNVAEDDPVEIFARVEAAAAQIVAGHRAQFPEAAIEIQVFNRYPGLNTPEDAAVVAFVKSLTGMNATNKVAFGTEGGLFSSKLGIPTVVCGPGSMAQGHKPDEFITLDQLEKCDAMLAALLERLCIADQLL